jgi:hypothetical protein
MWSPLPVLLATILSLLLFTSASPPITTLTRLPSLPSKLFYFPSSPTLLLHDPVASVIRLSNDEGATWSVVDAIDAGEAARLIQHPHDGNMAFVLGRQGKGWVTHNRGASWQSWEMDGKAMLGDEDVMSFHAENKGASCLFNSPSCFNSN